MAYTFTTAPASYIDLGRTISVTGNDITVAAWVNLTSATGATRRIINQKNNGITNPHFAIGITTAEKAIFSRTPSATSATGFAATGATTVTTGEWHHILGCQDGTEQSIWLDGVEDATNTIASGLTWAADAAMDAFVSRFSTATEQNMAGAVAEIAIWNVALTDAEKISLAKGWSPYALTNRRSALVECRLLVRNLTDPGIFTTTITNTSGTVSEHPRIIYPWGRPGALKAVAASTGWGPLLGQRRNRLVA